MKTCKKCGEPRGHNNPLIALCKSCIYKKSAENKKQGNFYSIKRTPLKKSQKPIKQKSTTNKNTPAAFSKKTKDEIYQRQGGVSIFSGEPIEEYHHAFYGPLYANYKSNRNNADQGVGLTAKEHYIIHHSTDYKKARELRVKCMKYCLALNSNKTPKEQ